MADNPTTPGPEWGSHPDHFNAVGQGLAVPAELLGDAAGHFAELAGAVRSFAKTLVPAASALRDSLTAAFGSAMSQHLDDLIMGTDLTAKYGFSYSLELRQEALPLLRACAENPYDNTARLVLADKLAEVGEEELGEWVRLHTRFREEWPKATPTARRKTEGRQREIGDRLRDLDAELNDGGRKAFNPVAHALGAPVDRSPRETIKYRLGGGMPETLVIAPSRLRLPECAELVRYAPVRWARVTYGYPVAVRNGLVVGGLGLRDFDATLIAEIQRLCPGLPSCDVRYPTLGMMNPPGFVPPLATADHRMGEVRVMAPVFPTRQASVRVVGCAVVNVLRRACGYADLWLPADEGANLWPRREGEKRTGSPQKGDLASAATNLR